MDTNFETSNFESSKVVVFMYIKVITLGGKLKVTKDCPESHKAFTSKS